MKSPFLLCSISNSILVAILALNDVFYHFQADKGHTIMGNIREKYLQYVNRLSKCTLSGIALFAVFLNGSKNSLGKFLAIHPKIIHQNLFFIPYCFQPHINSVCDLIRYF
jgi:hypothetical protein